MHSFSFNLNYVTAPVTDYTINSDHNINNLNAKSTIDKQETRPKTNKYKMVCEKCEKKLSKVITPDPWKTGARNTTEGGGRKLNENKALSGSKNRFDPVGQTLRPCR